jgi:hypothetical protein
MSNIHRTHFPDCHFASSCAITLAMFEVGADEITILHFNDLVRSSQSNPFGMAF